MSVDEIRTRLWNGPGRLNGLIVLVGSSPLPNVLAIRALGPPRVLLVTTPQTQPYVDLIKAASVRPTPPGITFTELPLPDAYDAFQIRECLQGQMPPSHALFYTGGTKPMAVHARGIWEAKGGQPRHACHLSDAAARLTFDDDSGVGVNVMELEDAALSIEELACLHELTGTEPPSLPIGGDPTCEQALEILQEVCDNPPLAQDQPGLWKLISEKGWWQPDARRRVRDHWKKFVCKNEWFEIAIGAVVEAASAKMVAEMPGQRETRLDLRGRLPKRHATSEDARKFQLDVVHRIGSRLFGVSCTTEGDESGDLGQIKLKIFEVEVRARQIGGDLARAAVVCLGSNGMRNALRDELKHRWLGDAPPTGVFGLEDVRDWQRGGLSGLQAFLRS